MHVSAVKIGIAPDLRTALENKICDYGWKIDFGKLFQFAGGDKTDVKRAALFGSRPPPNDSLWESAKRKGFEVHVYDRSIKNREKKIDTDIVATMMEDSFTILDPKVDEMTLVAGDADYVPAIEKFRKREIAFHVVFWAHAARELRDVGSKFFPLDPYLEHLRLRT